MIDVTLVSSAVAAMTSSNDRPLRLDRDGVLPGIKLEFRRGGVLKSTAVDEHHLPAGVRAHGDVGKL